MIKEQISSLTSLRLKEHSYFHEIHMQHLCYTYDGTENVERGNGDENTVGTRFERRKKALFAIKVKWGRVLWW